MLFLAWGGLVPQSVAFQNTGGKWVGGVLSFAYLGAATLFVDPRWLLRSSEPNDRYLRTASGIFGAVAILAFIFLPIAEIAPARSLAQHLLPAALMRWYVRFSSTALAGLGMLWLVRFCRETWVVRRRRDILFIHAALFLTVVAPIAISHLFSTRYVVMALTLLVLTVVRTERLAGWPFLSRLAIGTIFGAAIRLTYFSPSH
jgi:hypothetical protein